MLKRKEGIETSKRMGRTGKYKGVICVKGLEDEGTRSKNTYDGVQWASVVQLSLETAEGKTLNRMSMIAPGKSDGTRDSNGRNEGGGRGMQ